MRPNESSNFYSSLPPFRSFEELTDLSHYVPVPRDWHVIVTDVVGSTKAIQAGRYRDVNTLGAATVAVLRAALGRLDFPFVFGGDGATALVPASAVGAARAALAELKALAKATFDMDLRVGLVPASLILDGGHTILVARYQRASGPPIAIFRGGGLSAAEVLVKAPDSTHEVAAAARASDNVPGLSCRWQPIPTAHGSIASVLVEARGDDPMPTYRQVLREIGEVLGGNLEAANPVRSSALTHRTPPVGIRQEGRFHGSPWSISYALRMLEVVLSYLCLRFGIPVCPFNSKRYKESMAPHADIHKFDDVLRLVLDCSPAQVESLRSRLSALGAAGHIVFGIHVSQHALMTCLVPSFSDGQHIHFVDGGDGGYALAAKELKAQRAALRA